MNASELYQAGKLADAIDAALSEVKKNPTEISRRYLLSELLCFSGDLARADKQLDTIGQQSVDAAVRVSLFRHLIVAETARQQFFSEGRVPDFLFDVSDTLRLHLDASIAIREGNPNEAQNLISQAEEKRTPLSGACDGAAFRGFRDMDDLLSPVLEILTSTGKYYWVPIEKIQQIEFTAPERALDLLWRRVNIAVSNGPEGEVYLPTIYPGTTTNYPGTTTKCDDQLRLGRSTDWSSGDTGPVRGSGLRMFLVGEEGKTVLQLKTVQFDAKEQ